MIGDVVAHVHIGWILQKGWDDLIPGLGNWDSDQGKDGGQKIIKSDIVVVDYSVFFDVFEKL